MNFQIEDNGVISTKFKELNISDFNSACKYVAELVYKRNQNKDNLLCIFDDNGGTCSTKHAALRKLALENKQENIRLILGIFKMDAEYAPLIKNTLEKYSLEYIPEAHNYLKIGNEYFDFTRSRSNYDEFRNKILLETELEFDEVNTEKISIHKNFLSEWLKEQDSGYNPEEIWKIREECICDLQKTTPAHKTTSPAK